LVELSARPSPRPLQRQVAIGPQGAKPLTREALVEQLKGAGAGPAVIELLSVWAGDRMPRRYDTIEAAILAATNELTIRALPPKVPSARLGVPSPPGGQSRPPSRPPPELPSGRGPAKPVGRPVEQSVRPVAPPTSPVVPATGPVVPPRPPRPLPQTPALPVEDVERGRSPPDRPQPKVPERPQPRSAPQGVPREPPAPGPMWRDIPADVAAALDEAYAAHQRSPFKDHDHLYESWYKQSAKKAATPPGPEQIKAYGEQVRHHLPQLDPPARDDSYRYLDHAGRLPALRIYVNPLPEHAAEVFANVAKLAHDIPGFFGSKIGDAAVAHTARDVFVLYLDEKLAADRDALSRETRRALGDYHRHNEEKFVDEVPRFTHPVLKGVGIGAEPPGDDALTTALHERPIGTGAMTSEGEPEDLHLPGSWSNVPRFSFSTYRAQLIFEALQSTHDSGAYRRRILDNFAIAGIDANAPYLQGDLPSARVLYRLGLVYRTIRLTGVTLEGEERRVGQRLMYQGHRWDVDMVNRLTRPTSYTLVRGEQVPEPGP
jgi:HopA1 effector protein family